MGGYIVGARIARPPKSTQIQRNDTEVVPYTSLCPAAGASRPTGGAFLQSWCTNLTKRGIYRRKTVRKPIGEIGFGNVLAGISRTGERQSNRILCMCLCKKQFPAMQAGGFFGIPKSTARAYKSALKGGNWEISLAGDRKLYKPFRFRCTDENIPPLGVLYRIGQQIERCPQYGARTADGSKIADSVRHTKGRRRRRGLHKVRSGP